MKCCVKSDEWRVVLDVAAQETSQRLRERLNRVRGWRYTSPVPVCMEHLPPGSRESPTGRNDKMNLLAPLGHGQPVVPHSGLAGEEPFMNARQHNGALSTWKTDDTVLMGDELTGSHQRGDMTALGASRLQVPHAHRSVAATNNGEQLSVHGVHGTHCRPAAEWAQPGRRRPVDNWRIRQPVASRTHRSVTDVLTQNCHPCPETQQPETSRPSSQGMVSKSDTKEPNNVSPSDTNRRIMRFYQTHSVLVAAFVSDLDTPHRSKALCTPGTTREAVRRHHRYPRSPGSGRDTPPHPATPSFSWISIVLSGWPDIDRPGGWIVWTIMLRQPGSMSTDTSPFHRSRPPSQQVEPASPTRSQGPGRMCPPGSWRRHRCPACTGSSEASRCGRICPPCRVQPGLARLDAGGADCRLRRRLPGRRLPQGLSRPRLASPSLPTPHPGALSSPPAS